MPIATYDQLRVMGERGARAGATLFQLPSDEGLGMRMGALRAELEGQPHTVTLMACWAAEWHRLGYPTVSMGHKYGAALLSTAAPPHEIRAPWQHFLIRVPDRTILLTDRHGADDPVELIMCTSYPDRWTFVGLANKCEFSQVWSATDKLRRGDSEQPHPWAAAFLLPMSSQDDRAALLLERMILNTCVVMTGDPTQVHPLGKPTPGRPPPRMAADGSWSEGGRYELRRDVRIDCRQAVHDYLTGARHAAPAVRYLVRGHWRQQPHGPERAQRRTQWIEPFWKGMQDAPIAIREHDLRRIPEDIAAANAAEE